jgi:hypothetical protein
MSDETPIDPAVALAIANLHARVETLEKVVGELASALVDAIATQRAVNAGTGAAIDAANEYLASRAEREDTIPPFRFPEPGSN